RERPSIIDACAGEVAARQTVCVVTDGLRGPGPPLAVEAPGGDDSTSRARRPSKLKATPLPIFAIDEIAEAVKDGRAVTFFPAQATMRTRRCDQRGAGLDHLPRRLPLARIGIAHELFAPMQDDPHPVGLPACRLDSRETRRLVVRRHPSRSIRRGARGD